MKLFTQALDKSGIMLGCLPLRVLPSKTAIVPVKRELMPASQVREGARWGPEGTS